MTMSSSSPPFLTTILASYSSDPPQDRPHVTLTFAQSTDAKIGLSSSCGQLILSGKESMIMTHWMRTMHDAILIGVGTAINDNPQLNVRHLPDPPPSSPPHHLPQPVILDTNLRLPTTCKLLQNFQAGTGRPPWVICRTNSTPDHAQRKRALEAAGARILDIDAHNGNRLPLSSVLQTLRLNEVKSLMVEGGAQVIEAFLSEPSFVDRVVITIAPVLMGTGVGYCSGTSRESFDHLHTELFGKDVVVALINTAAYRVFTATTD